MLKKTEFAALAADQEYRRDIDGLRAIAVIAVVVYHAFPTALPGGFLGVDVFFVISGFLITGIIAKQMERGSFSFLDFYGKRIRRIFPALIAVLLATTTLGFAVLWFADMMQLGRHIFAASLFVPNLLLWSEAGYFDGAAQSKPLLHLWSLGVEEQFYILWPLLIWLAFRFRWDRRAVLVTITAASFLYSAYLSQTDPGLAFFSPLSRAWQLSFGGLIALQGPVRMPFRNWFAAVGMLAVVYVLASTQTGSFSVLNSAIATVGTGMIIASGPANILARHAIGRPSLAAIGLISYPLYLWHWPLLTFARVANPNLSTGKTTVIVSLSVALAVATYLLLERRVQRRWSISTSFRALGSAMIVIAMIGIITSRVDIRTLAYPPGIQAVLKYVTYDFASDARIGECWLNPARDDQNFEKCTPAAEPNLPMIALWGDSHAGRLYPGLSNILREKVAIAEYVANACPPIEGYRNCDRLNRLALKTIIDSRPNMVLLFAVWQQYYDDYASGPGLDGLRKTLARLQEEDLAVTIVGPFPLFPEALPKVVFEEWDKDRSLPVPSRIANLPNPVTLRVETQLKELSRRQGLHYISLIDLLCNQDGCSTSWSGHPGDLITWDYGHLTTKGAEYVGAAIIQQISTSLPR